MRDPALPGGSAEPAERRLAAGDWVRVAAVDPSLAGVGKLVEGDYDPRDGALRLARVEFARGEYWFSRETLTRLEADDEAVVCEEALERGLVDGAAADGLRALVAKVRRGAHAFVRTPGLLDRLWSVLSREERGRLASFFDEAARILDSAKKARAVERARVPESLRGWTSFPSPPRLPLGAGQIPASRPIAPVADPAPRGLGEEPARMQASALAAIALSGLDRRRVKEVALAHGIHLPESTTRTMRGVLAAKLDVGKLLEHLDAARLSATCRAVKLSDEGTEADLRARLARLVAEETPQPSSMPTPAPPSSVLDVAVGGLLRSRALAAVEEALGVAVPNPSMWSASELRWIFAKQVDLKRVLDAMTSDELRAVCRELELPDSGPLDELRRRVVGLALLVAPLPAPARAASPLPVPAPGPASSVLENALDCLGPLRLIEIAASLDGPLPNVLSAPDPRAVLGAAVGLARLLEAMNLGELRAACDGVRAPVGGTESDLRTRLARLAALHETPPAAAATPPPATPPAAAAPATPLLGALGRVLSSLNHGALKSVVELAQVPVDVRAPAAHVRAELVKAGVPLAAVLLALSENQLRAVARELGDLAVDGAPGDIRARILERAERGPSDPGSPSA